ncbi:p53-like transcription factor [Saccharata proteae CBS 121410]|uniref:P53-like transcription factor n=1 Tax=Saccharata proteae CBS 121410 TaxID=1314787 RepID=A0A9P4I4N8_9PEZI|nr:p53-like transcription factor [Saccharata proteae CBS 121410]
MLTYPSHDLRNQESPPFDKQETFHEILSDGQTITPHIECRVEKGFFVPPDGSWTCYRRNYFSVQCSYTLNPHIPNGRLYLNRSDRNSQEQIQAIAVTLSAAVDAPAGKSIELVQHTPKRDKGPQMQIQMEKLAPTPPGKTHADAHGYPMNAYHSSSAMASPYLPLQVDSEQPYSPAGPSTTSHQHIFERIQFKSATANNGKRRAQQQYYHLIVELCADVRKPHDPNPEWVRIAQKVSAAVVVRGRSPSHYQHEGPHGSGASRGGPGTGGGAGGPGGAAYGGAGIQNVGGRGLGNGLAMLGGAGMGGGVYRGSQYPLDPSPIGSHSVSSASSISGGPVEGLVGEQGMAAEEEEGKTIDHYDGYQYYPSPIAEAGLPVGMKSEYDPVKRVKVEYADSSLPPSSWSMGGCGRFQGTETSRGYYPSDLHTGY